MKRFLSMLISFVLICSFSLNVFAQDGSSSGYLTIPQYNENILHKPMAFFPYKSTTINTLMVKVLLLGMRFRIPKTLLLSESLL